MNAEFADLVREARRLGSMTQAQLAARLGVHQTTVSRWLNASQPSVDTFRAVERLIEELTEGGTKPEHVTDVVIVGRIGAGAQIDVGTEQTPPEGWGAVRAKVTLPADSIAFEVVGTSMQPRYFPGDVIVCPKDGTPLNEIPDGSEVALVLRDGRRLLKFLTRSADPERFILTGTSGEPPIVDVQLAWVAEIYVTIRASQWTRITPIERRAVLEAAATIRAANGWA